MTRFFYVQLAEADSTKSVEILRVGTFTDMNGKEVKITESDLDTFVANFNAGAAGQEVPIDIDHQRAEAGGWLKSLQREGEKLIGVVDWNELGKQLVGDKVYRYLSATVDLAIKTIKSVSLVNFPAVKGLKAIELSEGAYSFQEDEIMDEVKSMMQQMMSKMDEMMKKMMGGGQPKMMSEPEPPPVSEPEKETATVDENGLREKIRAELVAEFAEREKTTAQLREQVKSEVEAELKTRYEKRQGLVEFAQKITTGDFGLSEKPDEIVAFLEGLDEAAQEKAKAMLQAKVVKLAEIGSSGAGQEKKLPLPNHARADVIAGELTIKELFDAKVLPGSADDYDLSEFNATQKGF